MTTVADIHTHLKAVILVGGRDFGRCPVASRLNRALWPVLGRPAVQRLIDALAAQGVRRFVISCENQADAVRQAIDWDPEALEVTFQEGRLPRGPAGAVRDAIDPADQWVLVMPANLIQPPDLAELLERRRPAPMTVFLNPPPPGCPEAPEDEAQIYLCTPAVCDDIPKTGFFDLKEGLIPALVRAGRPAAAARLSTASGHFLNWADYLVKIKQACCCQAAAGLLEGLTEHPDRPGVWVGADTDIAETARLFGPVILGSRTVVAPGALVFGPTVIGNDVTVGFESVIEESVIWDGAVLADQSRVRYSFVDAGRAVPEHTQHAGRLLPCLTTISQRLTNAVQRRRSRSVIRKRIARRCQQADLLFLRDAAKDKRLGWGGKAALLLAAAALIAAYWHPTLQYLLSVWLESDEYSSGMLVPLVAGYVLWSRRRDLDDVSIRPTLWAFGLVLAAQGVRFIGLYLRMRSVEGISFVLTIGTLLLLLFGWRFFRKCLPVWLFLFLMLPLPKQVESRLTVPLQSWATVSSVFCLETLGFSVIREGNIIDINGTKVAVAEACNGLRMLTAFVVVCGLVALLTHRKWYEKLLILASSIPIALICNTVRLTGTAIAFTKLDTQKWEKIFHDFGGFAMMPLALALVVFELWLLSQLTIEPKKKKKQKQVIVRRKTLMI